MQVADFPLAGLLRLVPRRFEDERGYFSETFNAVTFKAMTALETVFVQDNQSLSRNPGTLRGLHCQRPPYAQAKLIRVTRGRIFDVAVDIRKASPTFGQWAATELSAENGAQLLIPRGFLHGFCTLEANTEVQYKVDAFYEPGHEIGVIWNAPEIGIAWPLGNAEPILSGKDGALPVFAGFSSPF